MIRSGIAWLTLLACSGAPSAELVVRELEQQPYGSEIAGLVALPQGDLLLRMQGDREVRLAPTESYLERWNVVYVLAPDGKVKQRLDLPTGMNAFFLPFANGFAMMQAVPRADCAPRCYGFSGPVQIVAYEHATDASAKLLYRPGLPFHSGRPYGTPDGRDLYVVEMGGAEFQITRIEANGKIAWQKRTAWFESGSFVATDDGVAFAQFLSPQAPDMVMRAIDREGQPSWETPFPGRVYGEAVYSAAGFIAMQIYTLTDREPNKSRVLIFDARTGQLTANVLLPSFAYASGTREGLLLTGMMLGQSYVGMLGRDGKFAWLRRYVEDKRIGQIHQATMTRNGNLVFATRERTPTTMTPVTSIVVTDRTAASLGEARGGCLDAKWTQAVEIANELRARGLWVQPPQSADLLSNGPGCSAHEKQFISFMQALAAAMPATTPQSPEWRQMIAVRLTPAGEKIRLESYAAERTGYPSARVQLDFAAPYDRAAEFWKIVATQVYPHLDRMAALDLHFLQMTRFQYGVWEKSELDYPQLFTQLETAARIVDEKIAKIPPAQLAEIRNTGPAGWVPIMLRLDGFGSGEGSLHPFAVADRTFLDIVAENRRAAAKGEITIRE